MRSKDPAPLVSGGGFIVGRGKGKLGRINLWQKIDKPKNRNLLKIDGEVCLQYMYDRFSWSELEIITNWNDLSLKIRAGGNASGFLKVTLKTMKRNGACATVFIPLQDGGSQSSHVAVWELGLFSRPRGF